MVVERLIIIGGGGHGRSVAEAATLSGQYKVVGFVDDALEAGSQIFNLPVLGVANKLTMYSDLCDKVIVAIGNNTLRESLTAQLFRDGLNLAVVIHPKAIVSPTALIALGCVVMAGAIVGTEAHLGMGVIVNCGAVVDHHAKVGDFGHLGVSACMAGGSRLGRKAWLQAGCALGYGVEVPADTELMPGTALVIN
jgi:sugar O-acyltransferase (sialic acid O-acetyltransferase NeuD family)